MKKKSSRKEKKVFTPAETRSKGKPFPIVAIGASAGGLEAISVLLQNLPASTGMAYIFVQHLSQAHKSHLVSILARKTKMKVQEIEQMEHMAPDNLYVIPNNKGIQVTNGYIQLLPRPKTNSQNISIDVLFTSLAQTHGENVIGVILSGNASDGTHGIKAIKEAGGITFAQDESAQVSSMPKSAIASGAVDFVLSPDKIADELVRLSKSDLRPNKEKKQEVAFAFDDGDSDLKTIFGLLRKKTGVDFSHYKITTIKRRLHHRMLQCGSKTIKDYARLLLKNKNETDELHRDLLINVTCFFRDKETFRYLQTTFLPKLLKNKMPGESLRIWVPACSTGEEVYSIAMLLTEMQDKRSNKVPIQIFATDLSEYAIRNARIGEYSQSDMAPLPKEYITRFFTKMGIRYRIIKEIREMCVFAPHNILSDPPFFRIDFISCRNLLIYFDAAAQKKALGTLHFALNDGGYLMLGKSETTGTSSQLFTPISKSFKIYSRKKSGGIRKIPELMPRFSSITAYRKNIKSVTKKNGDIDSSELDSAIDLFLLSHHMPACAIINKDMEILQFRGSTSLYLSHPSGGKANLNILKMIRPEFAFELRNAIHKVIKTKKSIRNSGIEMKVGSTLRMMSLEVSPLKIEWDEPLLLIVFTLQEPKVKYSDGKKGGEKSNTSVDAVQKDRKIKKLTEELTNTRSEIHSIIESQETAYEELQAANEEIVSTNEEFQTLNEELETSKEEIEATNEELISTNQELQTRNELLAESYNYSEAIIATIHEPMLILDSNLHIKSANKSFYKKFLVTKEETEGIPLFELGNKQWEIPKLHVLLEAILSKNYHFENFEVTHVFPRLGEKVMLLNASRIIQKTHGEKLILLAIKDITERAVRQTKEKEYLKKNIRGYKEDKLELEKAVRRRTRQLQQKNVELESVNQDLTTFTYVSSHDLQEPLRKIQTFVTYILQKDEGNLSEQGKDYFRRMQETAKRMKSLIEDLLTYSRAKTTGQNFEKTNLQVILNDVKSNFEELILEKKAVIKIINPIDVSVTPFQFRQLFHNLIGNSLKFIKPRTFPRITIRCKIERGSDLHIEKLSSRINYCHIIYTDNGIGFDPQYQDRIFEVFQRLHSYEKYNGTGIGLAICKRIIENHNGLITATGQLNKGARFDIYIPAL